MFGMKNYLKEIEIKYDCIKIYLNSFVTDKLFQMKNLRFQLKEIASKCQSINKFSMEVEGDFAFEF